MTDLCQLCKEAETGPRMVTCHPCRYEYFLIRSRAMRVIYKYLKEGKIIRPDTCELCGAKPGVIKYEYEGLIVIRSKIFAHHWNGHENALDVWWLCWTCNRRLPGPYYHSGQVAKAEARAIVLAKGE